jgi:hypothetical protein
VLCLLNGSEPYAIPMNHGYENGKIYFHCCNKGLKLDPLKKNPSVTYVVSQPLDDKEGRNNCHAPWESAIAFGIAKLLTDIDDLNQAFVLFMRCMGRDGFKPSHEI